MMVEMLLIIYVLIGYNFVKMRNYLKDKFGFVCREFMKESLDFLIRIMG